MSGVEDVIGRVPLLSGLSKRDRKELAGTLKERTFPAGTVITEEGKGGVGFFVIESGTADVSVGGQHRRKMGSGDYFGEIALIDEGPRTARVAAETDLHCYGLTAWEFRPFVQARPEVAWTLLQTLASRIRDAEAG